MSDTKQPKKRGKREVKISTPPMETRTRKKARQAIDFMTGTKQRAQSTLSLLGEDETGPTEQQLKMIFRVFDRDNDGKITSEELVNVLRTMGKRPRTKKIQALLDECDANKSGTIELNEFVAYMKKRTEQRAERKAAATVATTNKNGKAKKTAKASPKKVDATEKKEEESESSSSEEEESGDAAQKSRANSILAFFSDNAGLNVIPADQTGEGLGRNSAFTNFTVVIGAFQPIDDRAIDALAELGFVFHIAKTQKEFIEKLVSTDADEAWVFSNSTLDETTSESEFSDGIQKFHVSGGGLYISVHESSISHANTIIARLFGETAKFDASANPNSVAPSNSVPSPWDLIKSGMPNDAKLCENSSILNISTKPSQIAILLTSYNHQLATVYYADSKTLPRNCGRVIIDCGIKKFEDHHPADLANGLLFLKNVTVWLLALDERSANNEPLKGRLAPKSATKSYIWQFQHGSWHNYDPEAAKIVEEHYQDWLKNPYVDVRSVHSGHWHYMVDFRNLIQTNVEHSAHTQRPVRRVEVEKFA